MARKPPKDGERYAVGAVDSALDVVAALVRTGPATLSEVADAAGCTRVLAFRALRTLQARGLVMQDGKRGRWRLGASWLGIARAAEAQSALAHTAAPHLLAMAALCQETVLLAVRDGQESVVVAIEPLDPAGHHASLIGSRAPLHAGPGRLLLAYAPETLLHSVLISRLPRLTPSTRIDPAWIAADLPRIRARGWLIATDETQDGIITISTGVRGATDDVVAVLTIQGRSSRLRAPRPHTLLTPLIDAAAAIGAAVSAFFVRGV